MQLHKDAITQAAMEILRQYGLADVSMRRVAASLGVAPGALYWHIDNKQSLIASMAEVIVSPVIRPADGAELAPEVDMHPEELSSHLRRQLLSVRDGAEVVVAALAQPDSVVHTCLMEVFEAAVAGWVGAEAGARPSQQRAAASGLLHLTLGAASVEQSRLQLAAATGTGTGAAPSAVDVDAEVAGAEAHHRMAVRLMLSGLSALDKGM